jgi:transcriptional regulator with XRE-family HTH domain
MHHQLSGVVMLPKRNDKKLPASIRERRLALNMTQAGLASKANISGLMVGRYERGASVPSAHTWEMLNGALYPGSSPVQQLQGLREVATDDLIAELKRRGASSVTIAW